MSSASSSSLSKTAKPVPRRAPRTPLLQPTSSGFLDGSERLHSLFMHAPACIAVITGPNLIYELANPDYRKLFGFNRSIVGRSITEVIPDLDDELLGIIRRVATKGERFVANERAVTVDWDDTGEAYTKYFNLVYEPVLDENQKPHGLMVFANDVSNQVEARQKLMESESALRVSEQRLRFMAESMPQMVFTITPVGQLDYLNEQWEHYSGIPLDQLKQDKNAFRGMIHPDDLDGYDTSCMQSFTDGSPSEYEYRLLRKDGAYRWHINRVNPQKDAAGNIVLWIGSNTDIDDMKRAVQKEHELEIETAMLTEQSRQLMQLNQAKDEFISLASHQLRTPATGVKQYIGMLLQGYIGELTAEQKAFLKTAYDSNERQLSIVNDLLKVAQVDAGKVRLQKSKTDLISMIVDILNEQAAKFEELGQSVIFKPTLKHLYVKADEDRIRMVIENIIDNASKYTQPNRTITVRATVTATEAKIAVKDQGVGIAQANVSKIFDKFSRLDNPLSVAAKGSGLGLYWADRIIDLHHGSIDVKSELGKGTTFTVILPLH